MDWSYRLPIRLVPGMLRLASISREFKITRSIMQMCRTKPNQIVSSMQSFMAYSILIVLGIYNLA